MGRRSAATPGEAGDRAEVAAEVGLVGVAEVGGDPGQVGAVLAGSRSAASCRRRRWISHFGDSPIRRAVSRCRVRSLIANFSHTWPTRCTSGSPSTYSTTALTSSPSSSTGSSVASAASTAATAACCRSGSSGSSPTASRIATRRRRRARASVSGTAGRSVAPPSRPTSGEPGGGLEHRAERPAGTGELLGGEAGARPDEQGVVVGDDQQADGVLQHPLHRPLPVGQRPDGHPVAAHQPASPGVGANRWIGGV